MSNRKFEDYHIEELKNNPKEAKEYLKIAAENFIKDGDKEPLYQAMRDLESSSKIQI